jgi:hypothetical protein
MTNYPAKIDTDQSLPSVADNRTPVQAIVFNRLRDTIIAIEEELGVTPSGIYGSVAARLDVLETITGNLQIIELQRDLGGTLENPLVVGLQGRPFSTAVPNAGDVIVWDGIAWIPGNVLAHSFFFASGDLSGDGYNQTVVGLDGRPISPSIPSLGEALIFDGTEWAPDFAFVAGGDLTGSAGVQTIAALQGTPLLASGGNAPTPGEVLQFNGSYWSPQIVSSFTAGGDLSGSPTNQTVSKLQGTTLTIGSPGTGQALIFNGSAWAPGSAGSSPQPSSVNVKPMVAGSFTTNSNTPVRIGGSDIDMSFFPATISPTTRTVRFKALIETTTNTATTQIQLVDVTNNAVITGTIGSTSSATGLVLFDSGPLTVGTSNGNIRTDVVAIYEVQLSMTAGNPLTDRAICVNARVEITYS